MKTICKFIQIAHAIIFSVLAIFTVSDHSVFLSNFFSDHSVDTMDLSLTLTPVFLLLTVGVLPVLYGFIRSADKPKIMAFVALLNIFGVAVVLYAFIFGIFLA